MVRAQGCVIGSGIKSISVIYFFHFLSYCHAGHEIIIYSASKCKLRYSFMFLFLPFFLYTRVLYDFSRTRLLYRIRQISTQTCHSKLFKRIVPTIRLWRWNQIQCKWNRLNETPCRIIMQIWYLLLVIIAF